MHACFSFGVNKIVRGIATVCERQIFVHISNDLIITELLFRPIDNLFIM